MTGDVKWNAFTKDKSIYKKAWMEVGDSELDVHRLIKDMEEQDVWGRFWHPIPELPEGYNTNGLAEIGVDAITIVEGFGSPMRFYPTDVENAHILDSKVAVWYGDDTSWL